MINNQSNLYQEEEVITNYDKIQYNNGPLNQKVGNNDPAMQIVLFTIVVLIVATIAYVLYVGENGNTELEYEKLTIELCEAAIEYESKNAGVIDKTIPGKKASVKLQKLVDAYLIGNVIKDPRYKKTLVEELFDKNKEVKLIPLTAYIKLAVASNGEVYCEGLVDAE